MKAKYLLDQVEREATDKLTRHFPFDRLSLLETLGEELNELTGLTDWDWCLVWLNPVITTSEGVYRYALPSNFPENFVRGGGSTGEHFLCKISDGSTESFLEHQSLAQYYSNDLTAQTNSTPIKYSVESDSGGGRLLLLFPAPDSNSDDNYTVMGLYRPTDWELDEEDEIPTVPGNNPILRNRVLARMLMPRNPQLAGYYQQQADRNLAYLRLNHAKSRRNRLQPRLGQSGSMRNEYSVMES